MKIKNKDYEIKMGFKAMRILEEEFGKTTENMTFGVNDIVKIIYCAIKAGTTDKITMEDIEVALESDMANFKQGQETIMAFFAKVGELYAEAKN